MFNKFMAFVAAVIMTIMICLAPAYAKMAEADSTSSISLQCGMDGNVHFVARINLEDRVINITFADGTTDSAVIIGQTRDGALIAQTARDGALLAFKGSSWAISIDGGQSALGGGFCVPMTRT